MTRLVAREIAVQIIFGAEITGVAVRDFADTFLDRDRFISLKGENEIYDEYPDKKSLEYIDAVLCNYSENKQAVDSLISDNSKGWKLNRISSTALAVMRVAVTEIMFMEDIPDAAAIDSAVEIDKGYDDEDVVSFVNGVLGSIVKLK